MKFFRMIANDEVPEHIKDAWGATKGRDKVTAFINTVVQRTPSGDFTLDENAKVVKDAASTYGLHHTQGL
eukprot:3966971-Pyramimonas_sp.AAC.1